MRASVVRELALEQIIIFQETTADDHAIGMLRAFTSMARIPTVSG